ncbi:hypothetical protein D3C80_2068980 [compost metagenome]
MGRHNDRQIELFGNGVECANQRKEVFVRVDIFFTVGAHHKELAGFKAKPLKHIGRFDAVAVVVEYFAHRAARLDYPVGWQAFA